MVAQLPTVLVIDDEPIMGSILRRILRREYHVTVESDARAAVALIESGARFDVVVSDLMMFPLTGIDVYDRVSRISPATAKRFLFMTGGAYLPAVERFLADWPHSVLTKPFNADHAQRVVAATLRAPT